MPPDARRTKRERDASESLTIEEHIDAKRLQLIQARDQVPQLREKAAAMRQRASTLTARWQQRCAKDLLVHAQALDVEADARASMVREHDFETTVVSYLRALYKKSEAVPSANTRKSETIEAYVRHVDVVSNRRAAILDEYLTEMNTAPPKVAMAARDECVRCESRTKLLLCAARSVMTCPQCGYTVAYLDATSSTTSFDEIVEFSQYSYKRINHYMMWITLAQGKESHVVPDDIMNEVIRDMYVRQKIRNIADINHRRVRDTLRVLRLRRAYDHVTQITSRLTGVRPMRLSAKTEERLRNMFLQMQPAFQRHAPKTRTNFLSYPYVLYRCFQILGLHNMLDTLTLLKGRDKLEANDAIFRKMCEDLGWPIFDLPPASDTV